MDNAFAFIQKEGGVETFKTYPYTGTGDKCSYDATKVTTTVTGSHFFSKDEAEIAAGLAATGPLSAAVNASWMQFYFGGISDPIICNPESLDHGITLVGYGTGKTLLGKMKDFWIIKNSWGPTWGEKGYIRLVRGTGKCGINTFVITSTI